VRDAEGTSAVASPTSPRPPDTLSALLPDPVALPPVVDDRYELRERLGSGGHGAVYRVWDRVFRHDVALKVLQDASHSETLRARFRREAEVAHRLVHPNLLRVFELRADGPFVYFTMELVDGESLAQRLRDRAALPMDEALRITEHLLTGLAHLHAASLLHRDVKPSNVLLDREGRVKVADLGLVLPIDDELTRLTMTEALLGTLAYLSPEQALNQPPTPASDLYAVGLVLYEMLAGKPPYESGSSLGLLLQRMSRPPATLRVLRPDLPVWLHRVVERLLEPRLEMRYQSAEQVLEDLRRKRAALSPRRRRRIAIAAAAGVAALVTAGLLMPTLRDVDESIQLVDLPAGGLRAMDGAGRERWRAEDIQTREAKLARIVPSGPPQVFALRFEPDGSRGRLEVLDPRTGVVSSAIELPSPSGHFPAFSDRYIGALHVADLDGDGADEVLLDRLHYLYFPSVFALYEPRLGRYRELFPATGHHRFVGSEDLDGDGSPEILLAGVNNAFGWHTAIAALKLQPPANHAGTEQPVLAQSPDRQPYRDDSALLWYALAPPGACKDLEGCLRVDRERRRLHFAFATPWTLDFDGFSPSEPSALSTAIRQQRRSAAYSALREAARLLGADEPRAAAAALEGVAAGLTDAGLSILARWVDLQHAIALVRGGDASDETRAHALLDRLGATPGDRLVVAFEVAQALHLAGELDRAVDWYQRGLGEDGFGDKVGRHPLEYLRGASFALAELGRWDEAIELLERYGTPGFGAFGTQPHIALLRWRRDGTITQRVRDPGGVGITDEIRLLMLELRRVGGESPQSLLTAVEAELTSASYTRAAVESLRAELLAESGSHAAARASIASAYSLASQTRRSHVVPRLVFPLVEERWRRLRAGQTQEAPNVLP
jgi:tetratricopeptide (TPR) repeat protein